MKCLCDECEHCRWDISGDGWNEPKVSVPVYCSEGNENFRNIPDGGDCKDFEFDE